MCLESKTCILNEENASHGVSSATEKQTTEASASDRGLIHIAPLRNEVSLE